MNTVARLGLMALMTAMLIGLARAMRAQAEKQHQDELLDEALEETFPASDPIAVA